MLDFPKARFYMGLRSFYILKGVLFYIQSNYVYNKQPQNRVPVVKFKEVSNMQGCLCLLDDIVLDENIRLMRMTVLLCCINGKYVP